MLHLETSDMNMKKISTFAENSTILCGEGTIFIIRENSRTDFDTAHRLQ